MLTGHYVVEDGQFPAVKAVWGVLLEEYGIVVLYEGRRPSVAVAI